MVILNFCYFLFDYHWHVVYRGAVGDKMAELAHQKSVRSGHRGIVTKKIAELKGALGVTLPEMGTSEQLKTALEEKRALLKDLDERILALLAYEAEKVAEIEGAEGVRHTISSAF